MFVTFTIPMKCFDAVVWATRKAAGVVG